MRRFGGKSLRVRTLESALKLNVNQRLGGGEALSFRHHDLYLVLGRRFGVEDPAVRRREHERVGGAKLLSGAGIEKFLHFGARRSGPEDQRGSERDELTEDHCPSPLLALFFHFPSMRQVKNKCHSAAARRSRSLIASPRP